MSKSILQPDGEKVCYITGHTENLHKHHIYPGPNRKTSEKYGFWVYLDADLHNGNNPAAVHSTPNTGYDLQLKQDCQRAYECTHSREDFILLIGRNYLDGV